MIVKILKSFGGIDFDFQKDEVVELDDTTANYYISIGYAEAYTGGGGGTGSADWGSITGNIDNQLDLKAKFNGKVDKDGTKVLSTNDFTNECKALVQGSFQKATDTSDNITEGSTKLLLTTTERTKIANAYIKGVDTSDSLTEGATRLLMTSTERTKIANAYIKGVDTSDSLTEGATRLLMTSTERTKIANAFQKKNDTSDVITEGYANLFVTPAEKAKWNGNRTVYPVANNTERDALITNPPAGVTVQAGDKAFVLDDGDGKYAEYTYTGSMWLKTGDPDWANVLLDWGNVVNKPSTIAGYGITDALQLGSTSSTAFRGDYGTTAYAHSQVINGSNPHFTTFANIQAKPTTISGYGITDGAEQGTAYSNLENNVKVVQGVPAGGKMYLGAGAQTGAIKIKLPKNKTSTMFKFHVRINGYSTGGKQSNLEYVVKGYNDILGFGNTADTIATCQATVVKDNASTMSPTFYFCTGATEDYIIIGEITDTHNYKSVVIDDVEIHHTGISDDWSKDWVISLVTTLETLTSTYKVPVTPSLNATHLEGYQSTETGEASKVARFTSSGYLKGLFQTIKEHTFGALTKKTRYSSTYLNGLTLTAGAGTNTYGTAYYTGLAVDDLNFRVMFEGILQANNSGGSQGLSPTVLEFTKANNEISFEGFTIKVGVENNNLTLSLKHSSIASGGQMLFAGVLKVVNTAGTGTSDSYYIYSNGLSFFKQLSTTYLYFLKAKLQGTDTNALDVQNASGTSVFNVDTTNQVVTGTAVTTTGEANKLVKTSSEGNLLLGYTSDMTTGMTGISSKIAIANDDNSVISTKAFANAFMTAGMVVVGKSRGTIGTFSTTYSGDILGYLVFEGVNADATPVQAVGASIEAIQSGSPTTGSVGTPSDLSFKTSNGSSLNEIVRISSSGKVGIKTSAPKSPIQIGTKANIFNGNGTTAANFDLGYNIHYNGGYKYTAGTGVIGEDEALLLEIGSGGFGFYTADAGVADASASLTKRFHITKDVVQIPSLAGVGNRAVYSDSTGALTNSSSDERVKKNVSNLSNSINVLETLKQIRGVTYNWDTEKEGYETMGTQQEIGVIAQEIEQYIPQIVGENSTGYKSVDYAKLTAYLIEVNKALFEKIESLETKVRKCQ